MSARRVSRFDPLAGMTKAEYEENIKKQIKYLPPSQIVPGDNGIAQKVGEILLKAECDRVKGSKKLPLWPVKWVKVRDGLINRVGGLAGYNVIGMRPVGTSSNAYFR